MAITVQAAATAGTSSTVGIGSIWDQAGTVFLFGGVVYMVPATMASPNGYVTMTRVSDGANVDLQSNSQVKVAQSAVLIATF